MLFFPPLLRKPFCTAFKASASSCFLFRSASSSSSLLLFSSSNLLSSASASAFAMASLSSSGSHGSTSRVTVSCFSVLLYLASPFTSSTGNGSLCLSEYTPGTSSSKKPPLVSRSMSAADFIRGRSMRTTSCFGRELTGAPTLPCAWSSVCISNSPRCTTVTLGLVGSSGSLGFSGFLAGLVSGFLSSFLGATLRSFLRRWGRITLPLYFMFDRILKSYLPVLGSFRCSFPASSSDSSAVCVTSARKRGSFSAIMIVFLWKRMSYTWQGCPSLSWSMRHDV
mmetsp:Transcript_37075/g.86884  ORF Transcript_37075/g.86884 Transcript_37075/m.86884 type:complete len:281 (+) Transcript_37075:1828-2670(+)